ncbi:hypothetical protein QBC34DRAFT_51148 [Podospora aff. communis PSN243]|uniref:Ryanodine receptor Ryr domain-containing protein n=1 Tax=Podospora aff. communis PSN243 TaxID=3040156 RepID=A0AAV9GWW5_9PEZI|nr:hypothetical protein QBC34DRAFT_51148 [Podospora aff. communis PSN243]
MSQKHIRLYGAAPFQLLMYPLSSDDNINDGNQDTGVEYLHTGVGLLSRLLEQIPAPGITIHTPTLEDPGRAAVRSIAELEFRGRNPNPVLGLARQRSVGRLHLPPTWYAPLDEEGTGTLICVVQDAEPGSAFPSENRDLIFDALPNSQPCPVVVHASPPLCTGGLWDALHKRLNHKLKLGANTVVIVSAEELRTEGIDLSYGLSWERTCEDFVEKLGSVGRLTTLVTCPHLLVLFGCDGLIYHRGRQAGKPFLFFDPLCIEGDFLRRNLGNIPGIGEAFVAGFARGLAASYVTSLDTTEEGGGDQIGACMESAIRAGFWAARRMARRGLILRKATNLPVMTYQIEIPIEEDSEASPKQQLLKFPIPSDRIAKETEPNWSLIDSMVGDVTELARRIVIDGPEAPGHQVAQARFGQLVLFDRHEIETFRTLFNVMREYFSGANKTRPLCIALCGLTGSGKAFAAIQVAQSALRGRNIRILRFNLCKFTSAADLTAAFYTIRENVLTDGSIPVVYFNGFDTSFPESKTPFEWLTHLVPVMMDGKFSDKGVTKHLGPAVFFFGASSTRVYAGLRRRADAETDASRLRDFLGCLHGCVDVLGPNRLDAADRLYPLRRAAVLRALLEARQPNLKAGNKLNMDDGVLTSLLLVPRYRRGLWSLRSLVAMSRLDDRRYFELAALPPRTQLNIHVDHDEFIRHMNGLPIPLEHREEIAACIHDAYNQAIRAMPADETPEIVPWEALEEEKRESSRAHADSIPHKLRLIRCFASPEQENRTALDSFSRHELEKLSIEEHDRWCAERLQKQWRLGPRNPSVRSSPFFVPWSDMTEPWRDVDRKIVERYPEILRKHGLMVYRTELGDA